MSFKPSSSVETFVLFYNSKLILILGLVTLLYPLNAQITREQFLSVLTHALENTWDFETDRIDVEIKKVELDSSKRKYSGFKLDLEISHEIDDWERSRTTTSTSPYTQKQWYENSSYNITTSKQFLNNPSKLSLSLKRTTPWNQYKRYKNNAFYDNYQTQDYESYVEVKWKIPLMRHTNNATDLKSYHRNILDLKNQKLAYLEHQESFIYDRLIDFYTIALLQEQLSLHSSYMEIFHSIVLTDEAHTFQINRILHDFQNNYDEILRDKNTLTKELSLRLDYPEFIYQDILPELQISFNPVTNLSEYLMQNNRALKKIDIDIKLKKIDIAHFKNQLKPDFDLHLQASYKTEKGNTLSTEFDENRNDYGIAIEFKLPIIGQQSSETSLAVAQLNLQKINHKYNRKKQDLMAEIKAIEQSLVEAKKNIASYPQFILSSIKNREQEAQNYQLKTASIIDYIQAIENEFDAYNSQLKAKIQFQEEFLEYEDLLDRLITENNQIP